MWIPKVQFMYLNIISLLKKINSWSFLDVSDAATALVAVRAAAPAPPAAAMEPERLVSVKPEVQVSAAPPNHEPRAQKTYAEELRRDPVTDK